MRQLITSSLILFLLTLVTPGRAQVLGEINLLTDRNMPFPPGCLSIALPDQPRDPDSVLFDEDIDVPSVNSNSLDAELNVQIWRVACADEGYSVVLIRLTDLARDVLDPVIVTPQIFVRRGLVDSPFGNAPDQYIGRLQSIPTGGDFGADGNIASILGRTWMLAVETVALGPNQPPFVPEDYNDQFTIEMTWESYSPADNSPFLIQLDQFEPELDPPQFDQTILNGRHSGLFLKAGAERQGLVIQVAEQGDGTFIFAIFFTFIDGEPIWVVSNSAAVPMEPGPITMRADIPRGGAFMTDINQPSLDEIDLDRAGEISVEAVDCNNIKVHYDFGPINKGTGTLDLFRLVRTAGYDCNPWE